MIPPLGKQDLHWLFDPDGRTLKAFDSKGGQLFACDCRNRTTADGQYGHDGNCPPGDFLLGIPSPHNTVPFGAWFLPILDFGDNHAMADHQRRGIGIHGGGSGLATPFAPRQGWQVTHGCLRVQNEDLAEIVHLVKSAQKGFARCYLTVRPLGLLGGMLRAADDWAESMELVAGE